MRQFQIIVPERDDLTYKISTDVHFDNGEGHFAAFVEYSQTLEAAGYEVTLKGGGVHHQQYPVLHANKTIDRTETQVTVFGPHFPGTEDVVPPSAEQLLDEALRNERRANEQRARDGVAVMPE